MSCVPRLVSADEPSPSEWAQQRVEAAIVKPLADRRTKRFSRARPPPLERRVRVTQTALSKDAQGREFMPFAIDVRFGTDWQEDDVVGCVYRATGNLFVKRGDAYFPASLLLGKSVGAVAGVCQPAPARS
jgi:hypothetical protein